MTDSAQYFFNGLGYDDSSRFSDNPSAVGALLQAGKLRVSDLTGRGQHYAAAALSSPDMADTNLTSSAFWLGNLGDGSGQAEAKLEYGGVKNVTPSVSYTYAYGAAFLCRVQPARRPAHAEAGLGCKWVVLRRLRYK